MGSPVGWALQAAPSRWPEPPGTRTSLVWDQVGPCSCIPSPHGLHLSTLSVHRDPESWVTWQWNKQL